MASFVVAIRRNNCPVVVDCGGGWGAAAVGALGENGISAVAYLGNAPSTATTREGNLHFFNRRARIGGAMREELDPEQEFGSPIALPPDARSRPTSRRALGNDHARHQIEEKAEIKKRLGHSPDDGDAIVLGLKPGAREAARSIGRGTPRRPRPTSGTAT